MRQTEILHNLDINLFLVHMLQISVLIKAQPSIPNTTDLMHTNIPPYKGAYIFPKNVQDNTSKSYCRSLSTSKSYCTSKSYLLITEVLNKHMQNCRFSHSVIQESGEMSRGGAAGMGGERTMGGKGAHLGYCWWPAGRGSSRGRAGRRRQVDDEQDRRRASRGRVGPAARGRGRAWTSRGGSRGPVGGAGLAGRRRTGGGDDQILRGDERMAPRSLLILPRLGLVEFLPRSDLAHQNWPPSAAMCDYAPSCGDGLRPATRRA